MLNASSAVVRHISPSLALDLNPLNAEARIDLAWKELNTPSDLPPPELRKAITNGIGLAPIDARFYSLMGLVEAREGDRQEASRLFDQALALLPTEIQALTHKLAYDIEDGDYSAAVDHVELIGRRWGEHWPLVEPVLPALLSHDLARNHLISRFGQDPRLRGLLVSSLAKEESTLPFGYEVLVHWHALGVEDLDAQINHLTQSLIRNGRYADAFLLFRLTRSPQAEREAGYVHNGEFRMTPTGNPFDWQLKGQAGVDFQFARQQTEPLDESTPGEDGSPAGGDNELVVRFLNNPIQFKNISQFIRLAPGEYQLAISYAVRDLTAPKPLQLAIQCAESNRTVTAVELQDGSTDGVENMSQFAIPATDCSLQQLYIFNETMPMSWKNRYSGSLHLDSIVISRREN